MKLFATNAVREWTIAAANEFALDGEWLQICPWGEFENKVGRQKIERADGEEMLSAFNSIRSKVARRFKGLPIYVGHPDMEPREYPDKRRHGRVDKLEIRDDGLYGQVALNDLGKQALTEGYYLYNSPAWYLRRDGQFVRPVELISIGLTNRPQIPGDPWAKNETPPDLETHTMPDWLKNILLGAGLIKADATEDHAKTAVNELLASRQRVTDLTTQLATATNEKSTLATERDTLQTRVVSLETSQRDRELDFATNEGRIPAADRAAWGDRLKSNFADGVKELHAKKVAVNTQSQVDGLGARKGEAAIERAAAINAAVESYRDKNKCTFERAWNAIQREQPALFQN